MVNELVTHMTRASAPAPSVEAILHASLPYKYVDHTHADAVIAVTNSPDGEERVREIYGGSVVVIPYVMPGFDLARLCAERFPAEAGPETIGMVLMNHGIFSFGATARESYERMIELVDLAERYLESAGSMEPGTVPVRETLRMPLEIGQAAPRGVAGGGAPMVLISRCNARTLAFARRDESGDISQQGPATPDHVIRTKRVPMLGRDVEAYVRAYREYFERHASAGAKTMLDPAPRVILDPSSGAGHRRPDGQGRGHRRRDLPAHDGHHRARRAPRRLAGAVVPGPLRRRVLGPGAGQAQARPASRRPSPARWRSLPARPRGSAGPASSRSSRAAPPWSAWTSTRRSTLLDRQDFRGLVCDVTGEEDVRRAVDCRGRVLRRARHAGPERRHLPDEPADRRAAAGGVAADHARSTWTPTSVLMRECHPLLKLCSARRAGGGHRLQERARARVREPRPTRPPKPPSTQLARVAALEWGEDGIRVNVIHPNAVFDTGVWTDEVLASRAAAYGLDVESYRKNNVLGVEVTSRDVAELAAELCGPLFAKTTGAQIPVDGGNERVI